MVINLCAIIGVISNLNNARVGEDLGVVRHGFGRIVISKPQIGDDFRVHFSP